MEDLLQPPVASRFVGGIDGLVVLPEKLIPLPLRQIPKDHHRVVRIFDLGWRSGHAAKATIPRAVAGGVLISQCGPMAVRCVTSNGPMGFQRRREGAMTMAAVMARRGNSDDGPQNGLQAFAQELKAQREAAGLTQEELAKLMGYSASVIAKLETCRTAPSAQHAEQADAALKTPGTFRRMRKAWANSAQETWVRALLEMEERATVLRNWEPVVVPGLLQTQAYAHAILRGARPADNDTAIDELVAARMARQEIWDREDPDPPILSAIVGEAILRQRVGDAGVMREQLERLVWPRSVNRVDHKGGRAVDLMRAEWRKSSYSSGNGGNCVEVARNIPGTVAVRDSMDPGGPVLLVTASQWKQLIEAIDGQT